jgi:hypothetical protein
MTVDLLKKIENLEKLVLKLQEDQDLPDANLALFTDDVQRYKAYRWYTLRTITLKIGVIIAGASTALGGIFKLIEAWICV